mmetsp:Transcript_8648/g.22273  ORF Transcript_8648/g.22273 Transcript_8648/m.22273 type:complete len:206 (+) Transcript_8648:265-882(+)
MWWCARSASTCSAERPVNANIPICDVTCSHRPPSGEGAPSAASCCAAVGASPGDAADAHCRKPSPHSAVRLLAHRSRTTSPGSMWRRQSHQRARPPSERPGAPRRRRTSSHGSCVSSPSSSPAQRNADGREPPPRTSSSKSSRQRGCCRRSRRSSSLSRIDSSRASRRPLRLPSSLSTFSPRLQSRSSSSSSLLLPSALRSVSLC